MHNYIFVGKDIPPISTYNVMLGIGMIAFFLSLERVVRKNAISFQIADEVKIIALFAAVFGGLGAAFAEALYHRTGNGITFSGFTFYGGLVASLIALWVITRIKKLDFLIVANLLALPLTLAHAFGRIGCFLGGCCYGVPTKSVLGVVFPAGSLPFIQYGAQAVHPTQLYESLLLFLLSFVLTKTKLKWRCAEYLLTYPIIRFVIECFRGDDRGSLLFQWLSPSQEISLILFIIGIVILHKSIKTQNNALNAYAAQSQPASPTQGGTA